MLYHGIEKSHSGWVTIRAFREIQDLINWIKEKPSTRRKLNKHGGIYGK